MITAAAKRLIEAFVQEINAEYEEIVEAERKTGNLPRAISIGESTTTDTDSDTDSDSDDEDGEGADSQDDDPEEESPTPEETLAHLAPDELFAVLKDAWNDEQIEALADLLRSHLGSKIRRDLSAMTPATH
jgi:hypothetical protein